MKNYPAAHIAIRLTPHAMNDGDEDTKRGSAFGMMFEWATHQMHVNCENGPLDNKVAQPFVKICATLL